MSRPLDFFNYQANSLTCGGIPLSEIAGRIGTPVYIYSAEAFTSRLADLQAGLSPLRDATVCYAVKSNSNLAVLRTLAAAGAGADLVSGGELHRALVAGISPSKIVFSGVGKRDEEIEAGLLCSDDGIYSFHVESLEELLRIEAVASRLGRRARVAFRFNPNINARTHPYISTGLKRNKFGMNRSELLEGARISLSMSAVQVCGLSIHIGSQLLSLAPLREAYASVSRMVDEVEDILERPLEFVDLGGGVGVSYELTGKRPPSLSAYTSTIVRAFGPRSRFKSRLRILIEPGRTISANAGVLVTKVLYRKPRPKKDFLVVDAGMNDLMRPALYGSRHAVVPLKRRPGRTPRRATDLVGPVCESSDSFAQDLPLDAMLASGDLLAILSAGAYGMSMAGNYNSRTRPAEVLIEDGRWRVIRDRESVEDLIRGERP